jgi:hypothetical protein
LNWISFRYGFGTYLHRIEGYYSKKSHAEAQEVLKTLVKSFDNIENHVFIDTLISPSYTSAIAQAIQLPGISGMENNMVIFEYSKERPEELIEIMDNHSLVNAGDFDVCILASSHKNIVYKQGIHVWVKSTDEYNANLMILLSFIISGHPDWKKSHIKIFDICKPDHYSEVMENNRKLIKEGRLPITEKNIEIIIEEPDTNPRELICKNSRDAALTLIGFRGESLKHEEDVFSGYDELGTILFVNSHNQKTIE